MNNWEETYKAFGDLRSNQFHLVEFSAANTVQICSAITAVICGVLQNQPNSGDTAVVCHEGRSKVKAGEAITAGAILSTDAGGACIPVTAGSDTTAYICGFSPVAFSSGDIREIRVGGTPVRAA